MVKKGPFSLRKIFPKLDQNRWFLLRKVKKTLLPQAKSPFSLARCVWWIWSVRTIRRLVVLFCNNKCPGEWQGERRQAGEKLVVKPKTASNFFSGLFALKEK
jgi:hypothetical protein